MFRQLVGEEKPWETEQRSSRVLKVWHSIKEDFSLFHKVLEFWCLLVISLFRSIRRFL